MSTSIYDIATEFISFTECPVFITGKAGSGKTTLLRNIQKSTPKQVAIVAPTGVAAINAGGVTIHSFFQLPLSPFIPTPEGCRKLISHQRMNDRRRKILRNIELLVIDEVSMVRADIIDAIDTILRHYRSRRDEPFGGVQVVYIGDLYQLSPVCVDDEWALLRNYYQSPYFFSSDAVRNNPPFYIELDKIFRQSNLHFVNLLNQVRNNTLTQDDLLLLGKRYIPGFKPKNEEGYITLTTHNSSADSINNREIGLIDAPTFSFKAEIKGEFPEKSYPAEALLQLKCGAKVMFSANDQVRPQRYYNGKLGVVSKLTDREIWVTCEGEDEPIHVERNEWENNTYQINKETNTIEEKLLGSFVQYPLRLAWAITIHKSQGLTFDKVVIDAAAAFAAGQVYVALSRCRSLDGIVLTSQINPDSLFVNRDIVSYCNARLSTVELQQQLDIFKSLYSINLIIKFFDLEELMTRVFEFYNYIIPVLPDFNKEADSFVSSLKSQTEEFYGVAKTFVRQLKSFTPGKDDTLISRRIKAASGYYAAKLQDLKLLIETARLATESKNEADDVVLRLKVIHETVTALIFYINGIADDYSVTNIFTVKRKFRPADPKIKVRITDNSSTIKNSPHPELYRRLAEWRDDYACEYNVEPKNILSAKTLAELSEKMPMKLSQLSQIKGFTKKKQNLFGQECIRIIAEYCNGMLFLDETEDATSERTEIDGPRKDKPRKPNTIEITLDLLRQGKSVDAIAEERSLTTQTIYLHILKLMRQGKDIDVIPHVGEDNFNAISKIVSGNEDISNTEIFELLEERVSYEKIRLTRGRIQFEKEQRKGHENG